MTEDIITKEQFKDFKLKDMHSHSAGIDNLHGNLEWEGVPAYRWIEKLGRRIR